MKIAVVGGGICGLYLALKLVEKGEEVTVFEKKEKIGKEVCSGLFSERILKLIPESKNLIQNQIECCLIHFPEKTLKINFSTSQDNPTGQGKFFVMNHFELDNLVADLAQRAGVKILLKCNVTRSFLVTLQGEFDKIIGCDGALSQVRKILGLKEPQFSLGIQGFISKRDYSNLVETWPTSSGFIWRIPRGREIEYGIIEKPEVAKNIFGKFLNKNNLELKNLKSALVPQGFSIPRNNSITLCGDAVGLTKPWSGGGVIWGLSAVDILLKNFPDFLKYYKEAKSFFSAKIIFSKLAKKLLYFFGYNLPWFLPKNYKIESDFLI